MPILFYFTFLVKMFKASNYNVLNFAICDLDCSYWNKTITDLRTASLCLEWNSGRKTMDWDAA